MTRSATLLSLLLVLAAPAWAQDATSVFVGNQGRPASVTLIDPSTQTSQGLRGQLGGFLQGMAVIDGRLYVTGNSTRIDVLDAVTGQRVAQIQDEAFLTARYIASVGNNRAYVTTQTYATDATSADVVIINTETNTVVGRIALPVTVQNEFFVFGNPEGLAVVGQKAYVSQAAFGQGDAITVIDTATDTAVGSISTGCQARYPLADDDGDVIVPCTGGEEIVVIDSETDQIVARVAGPEGVSLGNGIAQDAVIAAIDGVETVYIAAPNTGLVLFDPDTYKVTRTVLVADAETRSVAAIGVDTGRQRLYLGRPAPSEPYSSSGTVTVHDLSGVLLQTYAAGIYPSYVAVYSRGNTVAETGAQAFPFSLASLAPNPAVHDTRVTLSLDAPAEVAVSVVDVLGREVVTGTPRAFGAGETPVTLDVSALPTGLYLVRAISDGRVVSTPLTVTR